MADTDRQEFTTVCPECGTESRHSEARLSSAHWFSCPQCGHRFRLGGEQLRAAEARIREARARIDRLSRSRD